MELTNFLNLVKRYRYVLIGIPLITVIVTFFLVRKLPNVYQSQSQLETGIVDESQNLITQIAQESQVNQKFSNMIAVMQMKKLLTQISYKLILHDLTTDAPFRTSKDFKNLNESARKHAIAVYSIMYANRQELNLKDQDQNGLDQVIGSMHYDVGSLQSKLSVSRAENSDFISIQYESENPDLSAYVVNTLISEFITYYTTQVKDNESRAVLFLDSLLKTKKADMDTAIAKLREYKIKNHILSIKEQATSLYNQLSDIETRKEQAAKDVASYTGAISNIDRQFNPNDKKYIEENMSQLSSNILATKQQIQTLTDKWIQSGNSDVYRHKIDSLKTIMNRQVNESIDKSTTSPLASKTNLITQKLNMQVALDVAKYSINSLDNELGRLHQNLDVLVPNEAVIQALENDVDVVTKEYLEILQKGNQAKLQSSYSNKLQQIDPAEPGPPQASKKMVLVIVSGVVSEMLCLLVLFILFFIDNSIKQPKALADATGLPVLGFLNVMKGSKQPDLKKLWVDDKNEDAQLFKDQLRAIRFEVDQELNNHKMLAISSLTAGEGKTLMALSLANAYAVAGKKTLLIDGNFDNNAITRAMHPKAMVEEFLKTSILNSDGNITVLGNNAGNLTLLELQSEKNVFKRLEELKIKYDVIIIETPPLDKMNKAKEWMLFADKTIAIFEANQTITEPKKQSVEYLRSLGNKFGGWVFNKQRPVENV